MSENNTNMQWRNAKKREKRGSEPGSRMMTTQKIDSEASTGETLGV